MVNDKKIRIRFPNIREKWVNLENRLAICILSCYNDGIKRQKPLNQLKREAEPTGYCAEFGENPKLRPSRDGNSFPSRMPPVSNIQEQICGSRVYFRGLGAGHSLSLSKSRNRSAVFCCRKRMDFQRP